ncbi:hypothetical protein [Nocardioides sp. B-3]|uniref:hypothetical protein n=1 Tax=Nocardioides sp. B-3 TaxID=2895565 RepID=UPI002152F615|nr:hypothetical protein [Nocardioides sp. B-3]UUZ58397.1 hypothetical protein LP418_19685 [Nocardioides sp. B-3]
MRALRPPRDLGLTSLRTPTLVLTGGSRDLYEQTAGELKRKGARHETLTGATHRIRDDPRTNPTLRARLSEQR